MPRKSTLALGGSLIVAIFLIATLPPWLTRPNDDEGAGEMIITRSGGSHDGTKLLAPRWINSGIPIPENGTVEARLLLVHNPCTEGMFDCDPCPPTFRSTFNQSSLSGKMLLLGREEGRFQVCGLNRVARVFGGTGLVALVNSDLMTTNPLVNPGYIRKEYRLGEYRDSEPHDGDVGTPFPHVSTQSATMTPILEALSRGEEIHAILTTGQPNASLGTFNGVWCPIRAFLLIGNLAVSERAFACLIGHVKANGMRPDLAQMALLAETSAHTLYALWLVDPYSAFY
jgi:hypothetical protein